MNPVRALMRGYLLESVANKFDARGHRATMCNLPTE
jgi:hypothetical protein